MIRILVDSSADFTQAEIKEKNMFLVPLQVNIEGQEYLDGVNLGKDEFYEKLANCKEFPKTSQPSPQEYVDFFEEVKEKGDEVICILLSSALSGTYQSAVLAKNIVDYDKIYLVDTLSAVTAIRILVEHAHSMIEKGCGVCEIVDSLNELKTRIHILAAVDTLEYLCKGGRLSKTAAAIGEMANLKPVITVSREGAVEVKGKRIGINKTIAFIIKSLEDLRVDESYPLYSLYSYGDVNCEKMESKLVQNGHSITSRVQIGPTIGTHIGPEAFGVCFVSEA